jgi:fatty-acyl-CoA synthase
LTESYWPAEKSTGVRDITLPALLREAAADAPDRLALVDGVAEPSERRHWTYRELLEDVERTARALLTHFDPGDRIAFWSPNSATLIVLQQAIAMAGMQLVALNPAYRAGELEFTLKQSGARALFFIAEYRGADLTAIVKSVHGNLPNLQTLVTGDEWDAFVATGDPTIELPEVLPLDPVQIQYTSGTTGFPKGALLHHKGIVNEATFVGERAGNAAEPGVCINAMPMYHIGGGAVTELQTISSHGTYVVAPGFDAGLILELIEAYQGTHGLFVPTMLLAMLEHPDVDTRDLSSLKTVWTGAAPVAESLVHRVTDKFHCDITILFGQTEMHGVISQTRTTDAPEDQAGTVGQPLPELEVKVVQPETGQIVPNGVQGEILCRGYQNMLGYYGMPEETAKTIDSDGWLHMGDLGTMDSRGFLRITGRVKDMIIRGGLNLYPREIEEMLSLHEHVAEVAVIGVPDEKWGEQVGAIIRLAPGVAQVDPEELKTWALERIAAHKVPSHWFFVTEFPMTSSGKIQKFVLQEWLAQGELVPYITATRQR